MGQLTVQEVRDVTATGRLSGLTDLIKQLLSFDLGKLEALIAALKTVQTAPTLELKIHGALSVMQIGAEMTPMAADDKLAAMIAEFATADMVALIARIIRTLLPSVRAHDATITAQDVARIEAKGFSWTALMAIVQQIMAILQQFMDKEE